MAVCAFLAACLVSSSILIVSSQSQVNSVYDLWDAVVSKHVAPGELEGVQLNVVDYAGISNDGNFEAYLEAIAKANTSSLSDNETYAFYINVYNALAIKMIIKHPCKSSLFSNCQPISGIKDIGSLLKPVWGMPAGVVGGKEYTLDEVEGYLRKPTPYIEDSRLHACIVCASISCPNVRTSAFRPDTIDAQMKSQMQDFLHNQKKGFILDRGTNTAHLSPIFQWFSGDFARYGGVLKFIQPYLPAEDASYMATNDVKISYFTYNWNANGAPPCHC